MCLLVVGALAAPLLDEPLATLTLKDGTVLRDAQARGFLTKVVMVKHRGGAQTVAYELFPDGFQAALAAKRPVARTAAQIEQARREAEAQRQAQLQVAPPVPIVARPVARSPEVHQGCRLTFLESKDNVVTLRVENLSDRVASLYPWSFVARTNDGSLLAGVRWVALNEEGRVVVTLKYEQLVAPAATATLTLMLSPAMKGALIETVLWK